MGRSLSPILRRELANLDKDADSRRSAMRALKTYVKDLDSKAIPLFLAQVSQSKETGLSGECTISLYEVLARVHGVKIVPLIDSIMVSIVKTLSSSAGSFPLQQACSKVVPAIARYGIGPGTPDVKKRLIVHSLCNPLADSLVGPRESLAAGAALCLKALVDAENWRFASNEIVNKVCRIVASALEQKPTQTNSHMGLAMALAKRNAPTVEPYARLLIQAGLQILNAGVVEANSQKRLSAIQMVNFFMRWLDPWSVFSELRSIMEEMEKCQSDQMAYVRGAAFEALQTAKRIFAENSSKFPKSPVSVTGSNFSQRDNSSSRRCLSSPRDRSPASASPESQTLESGIDYESWSESPKSTMNSSRVSEYECRSVNRKLWSFENGGVINVSLKDGLFSQIATESYSEQSKDDDNEEFAGFVQRNPRLGISRSTTTSPLRSRGSINVNDIIFNTPRKLVHSLQDPNNSSPSNCSERQPRRMRSLSLSDFDWSPSPADQNYGQSDSTENRSLYAAANGEKLQGSPESASSTDEMPRKTSVKETQARVPRSKIGLKSGLLGLLFVVLVAMFVLLVWMSDNDNEFDNHYLVPT